jgi:methylglyoxal synthase
MHSGIAEKPRLLIMASSGARKDPASPLLRLIRDYSETLKRFAIHATRGTGQSILGTGLFNRDEIKLLRSGPDGGVVEVAAMVARKESQIVIFISDPKDLRSDVPENRALQRVCMELGARLMTTLASAEQWAHYEANRFLRDWTKHKESTRGGGMGAWKADNWQPGNRNVGAGRQLISLRIQRQTLALIAHDKRKDEMIRFVDTYLDVLSEFQRILTTGTTGFLMKLLYASDKQRGVVEKEALAKLGRARFKELADRVKEWSEADPQLNCPQPKFVSKIMPLPSGPKGGDIIIANEVLENLCHSIVFLQDPGTAQPHAPDIRLFERSCQFWPEQSKTRQVYATCVSDPWSADQWANSLKSNIAAAMPPKSEVQGLRRDFRLRDVVLAAAVEGGGGEPGTSLARACAGYFHRLLLSTVREGKTTRIVLANGRMVKSVLVALKAMETEGLLSRPSRLLGDVIWSPQLGHGGLVFREEEASGLAYSYQQYYGGRVENFKSGAVVLGDDALASLPKDDKNLIHALSRADIALITAAPWDRNASLFNNPALDRKTFPKFKEACAVVSAVFLKPNGTEVPKYHLVGLGYKELRQIARKNNVILVCGGKGRSEAALAALRGKLASVWITTPRTARAVASKSDYSRKQKKSKS